MNQKMKKVIPLIVLLFLCFGAYAQEIKPIAKTYHVAIFSPLYLDSAFNGSIYKYGKGFPKFVQPGLDFVQGAQIALDSLPLPKGTIQANIYDTKAKVENIAWLVSNHTLDSIDLIIGSVKDADLTKLAAFAKQKNIPFVSATSPNDGGITANPFYIMINATLRAHCESIFSSILQDTSAKKIYLCRKKGGQEDKIADYFKSINDADGKPLLHIETINFEEDFSILKNKLDSNTKSIIIGGSLNEDFGGGLVNAAFDIRETYPLEIIGMPNWDAFEDLRKSKLKDFGIKYTASYYNAKADMYSKKVQHVYAKKYKGNPSDMSYKGFEAVYIFSRILAKYPDDFMSHLNEPQFKVFTEYNFKPVNVKNTNVPDYFENKHLYFMKILNGRVVRAW
jgi:ABC-type branched-subunit amino acid transport system substrate-binding protein